MEARPYEDMAPGVENICRSIRLPAAGRTRPQRHAGTAVGSADEAGTGRDHAGELLVLRGKRMIEYVPFIILLLALVVYVVTADIRRTR